MKKVKIITDSTNDLSAEILKEYDIAVIPLYVEFGDKSLKDGVELLPEKLFEMVEEHGVLPKTSAPSPYDFQSAYKQYIDLDMDILVITISSELSSTYRNAVLAAFEYPEGRIEVVDSRSLCTGIGILVMTAGDLLREGKGVKETADTIRQLTDKVNVSFVVDTLDYLYKGGRCNAVQTLVSSVLKIRPIIGLTDGRMIVKEKVRGDKDRALEKMLIEVTRDRDNGNINSKRIIVSYSLGSEDEAKYLKGRLETILPETDIHITPAGCVISSHCGPNTSAVMYLKK